MWAETDVESNHGPALWALLAIVSEAAHIERVLRVYASIPTVQSKASDDPHVLLLLGALGLCSRIRSLSASVPERVASAAPPEATRASLRSVLR